MINFNQKQNKIIYDFMMNYNSNPNFQKKVQNCYNNKIDELSILEIYVLEEFLRYGEKGIFDKFKHVVKSNSVIEDIDLFDNFIRLFNSDPSFKQYKIEQFKNFPETLSLIEKFAFELFLKLPKAEEKQPEEEKKQDKKVENKNEPKKELEYDSLNPIEYSSDRLIKKTLENLLFGEFIWKLLDTPAMKEIKKRQKENGAIANIDKPIIIKKIHEAIGDGESYDQFKTVIDNMWVKVKLGVLSGKGKKAFEPYLKYNTNVSTSDIFGKRNPFAEEEAYHKVVQEIYRDLFKTSSYDNHQNNKHKM